jgi:hypothetical protein
MMYQIDLESLVRLPMEIRLKIAECHMAAALVMVLKELISREDFRNICNRKPCRDFEEYWLLLKKVRKLKNEKVWRELASDMGWEHLGTAWKVLNQDCCWEHQSWAALAKYKLAVRGIWASPEDREKMIMQGCHENPAILHYDDTVCWEHCCYRENIHMMELSP